MAKANKSAVQSAPAASAAGAPPAPARGSSSPEAVKVEQEARDGLLSMAEVLAGVGGAEEPDAESAAMQDESAEVPAKAKAKADKTAEPDDDASVVADDLEDDGPVLSDDEPDDDDEDAEADGAAEDDNDETDEASPEDIAKALEKKTFKLREQRRELRAQLEAAQKEAEELRGKVSKLESLPTGAAETGPFANAKSEADIKMEETRLTQFVDWMDDLLDDRQEIYVLKDAQGQEVEHDRATLRAWKKQAQGQLAQANDARAALQRAADSDATARKRYPFVFNSASPHNALVLDLVSETPALNKLPDKAVLLGRLAVGKLVESGDYMLVKKGAKPTAKSGRAPVKATSPATPPARRSPAPTQRRPELMQRLSSGDQAAQLEAAMDLIPD
jgi:hypothetical protein